jgi:hypothetical protein
MQGLQHGMEDAWDDTELWLSRLDPAESLNDAFNSAFERIVADLSDLDEFNPVITPVLDLTNIQREALALGSMFGVVPIGVSSFAQAGVIAEEDRVRRYEPETEEPAPPQEITFEQNIYSPTALRTADIYKATRSQIAMAKKELEIP